MHSGFLRHVPSVCLDVCYLTKIHWTIIHMSKGIVVRATKIGIRMDLDAIWFALEGQGHQVMRVRVT